MKYLICLDLDGTTLNGKSVISPLTRNYIRKIKDEHIVCIVTGRPTRASIMFYNELGLNTLIGNYNGTKISNPTDPSFKPIFNGMKNEDVLDFCRYFKDDILEYILNVDELAYVSTRNSEMNRWADNTGIVTDIYKLDCKFDGAVFAFYDNKIDEILKYFETNKPSISARVWHRDIDFDGFNHASMVELHDNNFNKGTAVNLIKEYYKGDYDKVIAIGDSSNDIDMLKVVDIPIVMKNALKEVKPYAKIIAPSNNYNGVMKVLEKVLNSDN